MPGNVSGPAAGARPYTGPGGLGVRVNGSPAGVRQNVNYVSRVGVRPSAADDAGNDRVNVTWELDAEVLLGESTAVDVTATGVVTPVSSPTFTRAHVTRILVIVTSLVGLTSQPSLEAGTDTPGNPPNNDLVTAAALDAGMNAVDLAQPLVLLNPRPTIDQTAGTDVVRVRTTVAAVATTYEVTIQVYGVVVTP